MLSALFWVPALASAATLHTPTEPRHDPPDGFVDEIVFDLPHNLITSFVVDAQENVTYAYKRGDVWVRDAAGNVAPAPLVDLAQEVGNWNDHGLHAFAYDPNYASNGFIYLYYVVDRHHLDHYGTPQYDPAEDDYYSDTIGRLTRFTALDPGDPFTTVDPASRAVLLGDTAADGIPICVSNHGVGSLLFGEDGTLLASAGDAAYGDDTCFESGITTAMEDVYSYRAQLVGGRNGRVLRLDPATGEGVPGNPFFEPTAPASFASRTWVLGLRNPYRMTLEPGSGSPDPLAADPGTLFIADVGYQRFEELNVAPHGGLNFGWPVWEGMQPGPYATTYYDNLEAPNPLFGVPGSGCTLPFFQFQDLLIEDTLNPGSWPNPCDTGQQIAGVQTFIHRRPVLSYAQQGVFAEDTVELPIYDQDGEAAIALLGEAGSPVAGDAFNGNCAIAGVWYTGLDFPPEYRDVLFLFDYGKDWLRVLRFDSSGALLEVEEFTDEVRNFTYSFQSPDVDGLWYLDYLAPGGPRVRRILYQTNAKPFAVATAQPETGPSPLRVQLDGSASSDPEGGPLVHDWDFGDGSPPSPVNARPSPVHVFPSEDITAAGTFVSALDALAPPAPMGGGSPSPEVLRDGVYPPAGAGGLASQFDTQHTGPGGLPDKGLLDHLGWTFPAPRELLGLIFQEGVEQPGAGGWFGALGVEVRDAGSGAWLPVQGLVSLPPYPGDPATSYETFQLLFEPVVADGVRVVGPPGGPGEFVSAGELRVLASPVQVPELQVTYTASLTVSDDGGLSSEDSVGVSVNNTPPIVVIASPVDGSTYPVGTSTPMNLVANAFDLEDPASSLDCTWSLTLVHDNHEHPEFPIEGCVAQFTVTPHGELEGDTIYWIVEVAVADSMHTQTVRRSYLFPAGDCDLDGTEDAVQIAADPGLDLDLDGTLDACQLLTASAGVLPVFAGGSVGFDLDSGPTHAGQPYLLLGSLGVPFPGIDLGGGMVLPLSMDPYFMATLKGANQPPLAGSFGVLDALGSATASLTLPPTPVWSLLGRTARHAYVTFDPATWALTGVSNAVEAILIP